MSVADDRGRRWTKGKCWKVDDQDACFAFRHCCFIELLLTFMYQTVKSRGGGLGEADHNVINDQCWP